MVAMVEILSVEARKKIQGEKQRKSEGKRIKVEQNLRQIKQTGDGKRENSEWLIILLSKSRLFNFKDSFLQNIST